MIDVAALAEWMDAQRLGSGPLRDVVRLTGGTQNILLRFTREDTDYVLRRPPEHPRPESNETMRREARILGALARTAVPHPRLIAACDDEAVLGAAFYLMAPVSGFNPATGLPPRHAGSTAIRHRMGLALVEGIAALGAIDHRAVGLGDFGKAEGYLARQVARWQQQLTGYAKFDGWTAGGLPGVDQVGAWLDAHRPAQFTPGILHGDYHLANVMIDNDGPELAAIVDWELATVGDPLVDLGWLLATWPEPDGSGGTMRIMPWAGFPTADELVAHYAARSTRDLTHIGWYRVLACYKLGILLEGTHARACAGKAPEEMGQRLHGRAVALFERALRWIDA